MPYIAFEGGRTWVHSFPVSDLAFPEAGTYPLIVRLRYHDANMYPYSIVSAMSVQVGESIPQNVPIKGEMIAGQVAEEGALDLRVRNTGLLSLEARLTMVSPAELVVVGDSGKLDIPAGEEKQISYVIKNNGSLPGSRNNVHAIIEYSTSGQHGVVILEESVAAVKQLTAGLSEDVMNRKPSPAEWSIRDHMAHFYDTQEMLDNRVNLMLEYDDPDLTAYAVFELATETERHPQTAHGIVEAFSQKRLACVKRLRARSLNDLYRTGRHPAFGQLTILRQAAYMAYHEQDHLPEIEALCQHVG